MFTQNFSPKKMSPGGHFYFAPETGPCHAVWAPKPSPNTSRWPIQAAPFTARRATALSPNHMTRGRALWASARWPRGTALAGPWASWRKISMASHRGSGLGSGHEGVQTGRLVWAKGKCSGPVLGPNLHERGPFRVRKSGRLTTFFWKKNQKKSFS